MDSEIVLKIKCFTVIVLIILLINDSIRSFYTRSIRISQNFYTPISFLSLPKINFRSSHRWCSLKKVFLKILHNLQENACVGNLGRNIVKHLMHPPLITKFHCSISISKIQKQSSGVVL